MSEDEKKTIEILKSMQIKCDNIDIYYTINNLIENQQKEIKKEINK